MARRCFFSFHYKRDVWRAQQVKNSWLSKDRESAGFFDSSAFETSKKADSQLKGFLDSELQGSSVTCVLIGAETFSRRWVRYEIVRSFVENKGLLGVYLNGLRNEKSEADVQGYNPFDFLGYEWNRSTDIIKFKERKNWVWEWFSDIPTMRYSELRRHLTSEDATFTSLFSSYGYVSDNGYEKLGGWIESAASMARR